MTRLAAALAIACALGACDDPDTEVLPVGDARSAGSTTVFDVSRDAFAKPLANLKGDRRDDFFLGNAIFNRGWVSAPASVADFDGLGPLFNANSCSSCHFKDGRGRPPVEGDEAFVSMLLRVGVPGRDEHGGPLPDPIYGDQLQGSGILGVDAEGNAKVFYVEVPGTFADGTAYSLRRPTYRIDDLAYGPLAEGSVTSPRVAPFMMGLGLLEVIPEPDLLAHADPDDLDHDGVSGRANRVYDRASSTTVLGRFGWKANQPNLRQQNAGAFVGDMGITSAMFPNEGCTDTQARCREAPTGAGPQLRELILDQVTFYTRTLAVPARRNVDAGPVRRGAKLFDEAKCGSCHTPTFTTPAVLADFPELAGHTIHPYSDLLLHDMGPELADGREDFEASGSEWRTPPLWGIGLVQTVNRHELLLHDGRARSFAEAILWHGGEATAARDRFVAMSRDERDALVAFLGSL